MTTQEASVREAATSYAAALASGSVSKSYAPKVDPLGMTLANGVSEPVTGTSTPHSSSNPRPKAPTGGSSSTPEVSRQSTPTIGGFTAIYADDAAAANTIEEKSNAWEGNSQASSHKSSGADTVRTTESVQPLNYWKKRQEDLAAKPKSTSPVTPSSTSPVPTSKLSTSEKGQSTGKRDEKERNKDSDPKDQKKFSDEVPAKRGSRRGQLPENGAAVLPPPVTDTSSWPTPDLAQGEFKKEREEKEKEKPVLHVGRGNKTWVPVALDPPYVPPIQTKTGRGMRVNRAGREGGRGGVAGATHGERSEKAGIAGEGDWGRQYPSARYQGGKGPKYPSSPGGAAQRREPRAGPTNGISERRKEASEGAAETSSSGTPTAATQTDKARLGRTTEDVSDPRQYLEEKFPANGYAHQARPERGAGRYAEGRGESDPSGPYMSRERGSERSRGGYRGRGNYHGQFPNGHPNGHSNANHASNPQFSPQNVNGQIPQHPHPRGGSYSRRGHAYNSPAYRFNPAMQPPPAPHFTVYGSPYDYAMISSGGMPPPEFQALIIQMNYYFSVENLCKDIHLRKHMDSDGFVRLSFFMGFPRVQLLTKELVIVRDACQMSPEIHLQYGLDDYYVRKSEGWENWVLKEEDRDESAKREQSDWHIDPRQRKHNGLTPPGEMSGSAEPFFPGSLPMAPMYYSQSLAAINAYGYTAHPMAQPTALSAAVAEFSPSSHHGHEGASNTSVPAQIADECLDSEVDTLVVVVKRPATGESTSASPELNRHIPNGVSDAATIRETAGLDNGDGASDETERRSQPNGIASHRSHRSQSDIGWFNSPRTGPVEETNMSHRSYTEVRAQAIKQRDSIGTLKPNNDMITLYKFWSHFLVKRFNASMYREFKNYALLDAGSSSRHGIEEIFKLYERSLKDRSAVGFEMIRDFVDLVKLEVRHGESLGIEKLKSSLANPNIKDDYKTIIESLLDPDLRGIMSHGKMNSRSPAAEPSKASAVAS